MKTNTEKDEKVCWGWACKRNLIGESTFGLCLVCLNKYGSLVIGGISSLVSGLLFINGGKVAKGALDKIKLNKS
jgi:hypothetical protein